MIHYTQIIWEKVAFIWKVTGKAVAIFMTGTVVVWPAIQTQPLWGLGLYSDTRQKPFVKATIYFSNINFTSSINSTTLSITK